MYPFRHPFNVSERNFVFIADDNPAARCPISLWIYYRNTINLHRPAFYGCMGDTIQLQRHCTIRSWRVCPHVIWSDALTR